ncbi:MAG: DNA starvation/stationary phase protection protein [Fimbriimonadaceae bacterium]|nr:MAG: DNA starvation/stationary phase protection protein [Fimbriimonadaceae bacterium]
MNNRAAAESLSKVLADTYVLMLKTQNVHWHVVGASFVGIHKLSEEQYNELFMAVDEIAERIRALGATAPGSMAEYLKLARIKEGVNGSDDAAMVQTLVDANQEMAKLLRKEIDTMDDLDDYGSEDMLIARLQVHEKVAWMWDSMLGQMGAKKTALEEVKEKQAEAPKVAEKKAKEVKAEKVKEAPKAKEAKAKKEKKVEATKAVAAPKPKAEPAPEPSGGGRRRQFNVKANG